MLTLKKVNPKFEFTFFVFNSFIIYFSIRLKALICILSFVLISNSCLSQKDSTLLKNQLDLDIHLIALELNYKRSFSKKISVGAGILFGPTMDIHIQKNKPTYYYDPINMTSYGTKESHWKFSNDYYEIIGFKCYIDYRISKKFHFHLGPKIVPYNMFEITEWYRSFELGIFYNTKNMEIGIKPSFGNIDGQTSMSLPLFLLKLNLKKW